MTLIDLTGKCALVTGGSRGIGAATAVLLAKAGARVAITYRSRKAEAERVVEVCDASHFSLPGEGPGGKREEGSGAFALRADFSRPETAERAVQAAYEAFGRLDILVASAGVWPAEDVPIADMSPEQWRTTLAINLDAVFHACRAALRVMGQGGKGEGGSGGRIVLISSTAGQRGEGFHADYAASKGAIIALTKSLCIEGAPRGITVNSVAPGWVDTEMARPVYEREGGSGKREIETGIPLGRVATPEDIAGPIVFLCSDLARHITGEILNVNGGAVLVG